MKLAGNVFFVCALFDDGGVACWGDNENGALGAGAFPSGCGLTCDHPVAVKGVTDATDLVVGSNHTCALRAGGKVSCWGAGQRGRDSA